MPYRANKSELPMAGFRLMLYAVITMAKAWTSVTEAELLQVVMP
jgi:hypothetical protein